MPAAERPRDQLLERTRQLEPLLDISPSAVVIMDLESNVVAWNPAAAELFGYTADEAVGRNLDDLVAKTDELHQMAVDYSEQTLGKHQIRTDTRRTRKDGTLVDVELRAAPLLANGEPIGMFGIYHDITELTHQHRFLETLLEMSPEAIVTTTPDDAVTSWNPAAERLFGHTAEEAVGRNIDDLVARGDLHAEGLELSGSAMLGPTAHKLTQRTRKDGSLVDVDIVGGPITVRGELVGKHVFYHDISELQRQRRYYEALFESSPVAVALVDSDGKVTAWNPAAEELFGYSAEEAIGGHTGRPQHAHENRRIPPPAAQGRDPDRRGGRRGAGVHGR